MTNSVEAIYSHGVLTPLDPVELREQQRVRLTIETLDGPTTRDRSQAVQALIARLRQSPFAHGGPYPTRDELHERDGHV